MDSIAKTSLLTAAMRAVETQRTDQEGRLFVDPYAEILAGEEGLALLKRALAESGEQPSIAIRTAFMDEKIIHAVDQGVRQIVMLASGMDTRAYRLLLPKETVIFELDRKEVLDYKAEKLKSLTPRCHRKALKVDLTSDWENNLLVAHFDPGTPSLWLVEGLLMYLEESQVHLLLDKIGTITKKHDYLLLDILSQTLLNSPFMQKQLDFLKNIGAPWRFGVNEPEEFLLKWGWSAIATQAGEYAPTRWPFPLAPRSVPSIPRGFFVEARKL